MAEKMIDLYPNEGGIVSYGVVDSEPIRADGYCLLIGSDFYDKYKLDENYAWWWGVTKLESQILKAGKRIIAVRNHEEYIHHFGGKLAVIGKASGMDTEIQEILSWFTRGQVVWNVNTEQDYHEGK